MITYSDFLNSYESGNDIIPVYRKISAESITPILAYYKLFVSDEINFFFESAQKGNLEGRFSIAGSNPSIYFLSENQKHQFIYSDETKPPVTMQGNPFDILAGFHRQVRYEKWESKADKLPIGIGLYGFWGYDTVSYIESHIPYKQNTIGQADAMFMLPTQMFMYDHFNEDAYLVYICNTQCVHNEGEKLKELYKEAEDWLDSAVDTLLNNDSSIYPAIDFYKEPKDTTFRSNKTQEEYEKLVEKAKEYILAGDIFQVQISQRLSQDLPDSPYFSPFSLYRILRKINPSPYMFFISYNGKALVGSSPEVMIQYNPKTKKSVYKPIAGTILRGENEIEDDRLAQKLLNDPKERAEHIMLVDLGRNDLGRVSKIGSVKVDELMVIEKYSHVQHIVSKITGELVDDHDAYDLFRAVFPAGTLTGAPKVRSMEVIQELEGVARGPYGGAVGYFGFDGTLNTGIIIRTMYIDGKHLSIQAAGGIVADSTSEGEYRESLNKMKALMKVLNIAKANSGGL